jgi:hypothetical protein
VDTPSAVWNTIRKSGGAVRAADRAGLAGAALRYDASPPLHERIVMTPFRISLLCLAATVAAGAQAAKRTAAGAVSANLAADYRIGKTDLPNDYGWCVDYGKGGIPPHLTDARRTSGGGTFIVSVRLKGSAASQTPTPDRIEVASSYPNEQSLTFAPYPGIEQKSDFLVLSSRVTAQRITLRNKGTKPAVFTITPVASDEGVGFSRRRYRGGEGSVSTQREGARPQFVTLAMPGASSFSASEDTGAAAAARSAGGALANSVPMAALSVIPSASFTNPGDSVAAPLLAAGARGDRRWTAWNSRHPSDWYQVDFDKTRTVRAVTLRLFVDNEGCWPPTAIGVEQWNGSAFEPVAHPDADPIPSDGRPMTIRFDETTTSKIRVVMTWRGSGLYGGLRSFQTDPPLPALASRSTLALRRTLTVAPGKSASFVVTLTTAPTNDASPPLSAAAFEDAMRRTAKVNETSKRLAIGDPVIDPLIQQQINLVAQTVIGPQGRFDSPSFVFTRGGMHHPGWTEDHQHAHEGLAYIPLATTDPHALRGILRSFFSEQAADGRVPYETSITGPGGDIATFPSLSLLTWRLYKATGDKGVLKEFIPKLKAFNAWWYANRRDAPTGLFWWGSFESTRDGANPEDLRGPKLGLPHGHADTVNPDLTALIYADNRLIANMADALGDKAGAARYRTRAADLKRALEFLWDDKAANYQYRAKSSVQPDQRWVKIVDVGSLLPLWAGMVDAPRAKRIIETHLLNPKEMWRKNGIPSLSAAEPEYTAAATSSNWNGQLWIQWNTLFVDALLQYGYTKQANELARRVAAMQAAMLKTHKHFFECYSADNLVHTNAIYDYNWGGGNIQSFMDIAAAKRNGGKFSIYK